jgi:glycosyltransferase involved in cell wall biosynthesis
VRVIRQDNQGESVARNRGIDEAAGEWIALLDADDRWTPNKLKVQLEALQRAPQDTVCVYSDLMLFGSENRRMSLPPWPVEVERRVRMLTNPVIQPGTALICRRAAERVRFPVGISDGEDQVFWMLLCDQGKIVHVPEVLLEYRKYQGQQTSRVGHGVRVIDALWGWALENRGAFSAAEWEIMRHEFGSQLVDRHDAAYWQGDWPTVQRARRLFGEMLPEKNPLPPLFQRAPPRRITKRLHRAWNTMLTAMPDPMRSLVQGATRGLVDRIKRGRPACS